MPERDLPSFASANLADLERLLGVSVPPAKQGELRDLLRAMGRRDATQARVVELKIRGGLSNDAIAETVGVSRDVVEAELRHAKAWLRRELGTPLAVGPPPGGTDEETSIHVRLRRALPDSVLDELPRDGGEPI